MDVFEDQVRRVLDRHVQDVTPHLRGTDLRAMAASRGGLRVRISGQLAAAAAVLAIAVVPFLLRHDSPTPAQPAGPVTVVPTPTPTPPPRPSHPPSSLPPIPTTAPKPGRTTGIIDPRPARSSEVPTAGPARPLKTPIRGSFVATRPG